MHGADSPVIAAHAAETRYRPDVDGLRAVAILAVVAYHVGLPGVSGGFVGVDVFFVISGYLITLILARELQRNGRVSIAGFYVRRIRRLLPLLALVVVATLLASAALLPPLRTVESTAYSAVAAAFFVANHYFVNNLGGYFDEASETLPLLHLWSLSVEEQFYLLYPLALAWAARLPAAHRLTWIRRGLIAGALVSLAISVWLVAVRPIAGFYVLPSRAWELALGALVALAPVPARCGATAAGALGAAGLVAIAASIVLIGPATPFPGWAAVPVAAGSAAVLWAHAVAPRAPGARWLASKPMVAIGKLSYGWYLWHWPLLAIGRAWRLGERDAVADAVLAAVALALSAVTYRFVENPFRYGMRSVAARRPAVFGAGAALIAAVVATAAGVYAWTRHGAKEGLSAVVARASVDRPADHESCSQTVGSRARLVEACLAPPGVPRLLLWGDSFADHWAPALDAWRAAAGDSLAVERLTKNGCPPLLGLTPSLNYAHVPRPYDACREFNALIAARLAAARAAPGSGVVVASNWWHRAPPEALKPTMNGEDYHTFDVGAATRAASIAALQTGLRTTLRAIEAHGLRAVVVLQSPVLRNVAPACVYLRREDRCSSSDAEHRLRSADVDAAIRAVAAEFAGVRVVDPAVPLCRDGRCGPVIDGTIAYTDRSHLTASMSRALAGWLAPELAWLVGQRR